MIALTVASPLPFIVVDRVRMFVSRFSFEGENYTANYEELIRRCAMPRKARAKRERENRPLGEEGKRREKRRGSSGNFGTELVDESVGGYRRLLSRRATSNTRNKRVAERRNGKRMAKVQEEEKEEEETSQQGG